MAARLRFRARSEGRSRNSVLVESARGGSSRWRFRSGSERLVVLWAALWRAFMDSPAGAAEAVVIGECAVSSCKCLG